MIEDYAFLMSHVADVGSDPYTTELLHPDGAFFALLCLFSWVLFLILWAWNHKPPPRQRPRGNEKDRPRSWEVPWGEHWRN